LCEDVSDDEERRRRENNINEERDRDRQRDRKRQNDRMEEREREGQRDNYRDDEQQQYIERQRNNYWGRQRWDEAWRYSDSSEEYDYDYWNRRWSREIQRIGRRYWDNTDSGSEYEAVAGTLNDILTELRNDRASRQAPNRESLPRELLPWGVVFHGKEDESVDSFIELVNQFKEERAISSAIMLSPIPELLKDKDRSWFFIEKADFNTWEIFLDRLRQSYRKPGYETKLQRDLYLRTQGTLEPFEAYITIMRSMNSRLDQHDMLSEKKKVCYLFGSWNAITSHAPYEFYYFRLKV
jgi:hypothetical protein